MGSLKKLEEREAGLLLSSVPTPLCILMAPSEERNTERSSVMSPREDSEGNKNNMNMKEVEKERDYYMQFELNPDFRRFVRKLSRCRSIASLDVSNVVSGDVSNVVSGDVSNVVSGDETNTNNNEPLKTPEKIEDEKGKKGETKNDNIQIRDYKPKQRHQRERKVGSWMNTDFYEESGRGEVSSRKQEKQRRHSDIFHEGRNMKEFGNFEEENYDNNQRASISPMSYSSQSLPRREKRASVILREKHQSMMMIQEGDEPSRPATFSLPRVSCFHRSTRV